MRLSKAIAWQNLLMSNFERAPQMSVPEMVHEFEPLLSQMSGEADKKSDPPMAPYKSEGRWLFSDGSLLSFCEAFGTFSVFVMHWRKGSLFRRPYWQKVSEQSIGVKK